MKKLISVLLACCLLLCVLPAASASASTEANATYLSTKSFLIWLESNDIIYDYIGVDDDGYEIVLVDMSGDNFDFSIKCVFYDGNGSAAMYVYNVIEYHKTDFNKALSACNDLNASYRYASFFCDESDNTVTAQTDMLFVRTSDSGDLAGEHLLRIAAIVDDAYPDLAACAK